MSTSAPLGAGPLTEVPGTPIDVPGAPLDVEVRDRYLARLGWSEVPESTVGTLVALHRAHVERIPYETLWIALGERRGIEPLESARTLTSGSGAGGYCYHLNGAFSLLLEWLGFDVRRHLGGVQALPSATNPSPVAGANGNHLAVTVRGLDNGSEVVDWMVDVGLGDALHDPVPIVGGEVEQGPFRFRLRPSEAEPGGSRFDHHPKMSFAGFDVRPGPVDGGELEPRREFLSTSAESGFVRVVMAQRRDGSGFDALRGRVLRRIDADRADGRELADRRDWRTALADVFGITLRHVDPDVIASLWRRIATDHETLLGREP